MSSDPVNADIFHAGAVTHIPKQITALADKLARSQDCKVTLSKERSGYHLYLPCPACLATHGRDELKDPKYAINLSKYFGIGDDFRHLQDLETQGFNPVDQLCNQAVYEEKNLKTGICMRTWQSATPHRFPVDELLEMGSISVRHPDIQTRYRVINGADSEERESHWEEDPVSGELCPPPAGEITPILDLPEYHPARWYLEKYRKFDLKVLTEMFRCGFCTKEYPMGQHNIWYRKFPGGWKDTPQGRIIFHSLHKGVPLTWQGRYIERVSEDGLNKYALNPYTSIWDHLATRGTAVQAWMPVSPFDEIDEGGSYKFDPAKYKNAKHSGRELMGWDAATKRANEDDNSIRWCVLVEGPLDAARIGPGGLAIMGKSLGHDNAAKIASDFHLVLTAFDNDKSGEEATEKISASLKKYSDRASTLNHVESLLIPSGKDLGDLDQAVADELLLATLKRAMRSL